MENNKENLDYFKSYIKGLCNINNISSKKVKFEKIENIIVINISNKLEDGIDLESFKILNLIYQVISPLGIKFQQQLYIYPNSERVDRITINFEKETYNYLNRKIKNGNIDS